MNRIMLDEDQKEAMRGILLDELAQRCVRVEELEEKQTEYKPVRGKDNMWVEAVGDGYAVYWYAKVGKVWSAIAIKNDEFVGGYEHDEPFDYREALKEWLK